jgi:hypothetical protein
MFDRHTLRLALCVANSKLWHRRGRDFQVDYYNRERIHGSLSGLTPQAAADNVQPRLLDTPAIVGTVIAEAYLACGGRVTKQFATDTISFCSHAIPKERAGHRSGCELLSSRPGPLSSQISGFQDHCRRLLGHLSGAGFRYKKLRDRESCSLSLNDCFGQFSVSTLNRDVVLFVHFATRALGLNSVEVAAATATAPQGQDAGRHHPGLDKHLWIFDRHVVVELISDTCEFLDDMHAAGVDEAPSSQPRGIVE